MKAFIFDLDGVIVDTAKYHYLAWKRLAKEFDFELSELDNERLKGVSRIDSLAIILRLAGKQMDQAKKHELADKKNTWFLEYVNNMTPAEILPGSVNLLEELKTASFTIALASSSKNARTILNKIQLTDYFDVIVDGTMITHSKPHPEIFIKAARLAGVPANECLVFEDAEAGVEAAVHAGMRCVGIGNPDRLHKAFIAVSDLSRLNLQKIQSLFQHADTVKS